MPWYYAIAEHDHELQNPTSPEKIRLLGERLRLGAGVARARHRLRQGRAGVAARVDVRLPHRRRRALAGVRRAEAQRRIADAGLGERSRSSRATREAYPIDPESFDAALCLGASFVWDGLEGTLAALAPAVRPGGHVVVGEPFWRSWPLPEGRRRSRLSAAAARPLPASKRPDFRSCRCIAASEDDWDTYKSLHWRALEEWLAANPGDPDAPTIRERHEHTARSTSASSARCSAGRSSRRPEAEPVGGAGERGLAARSARKRADSSRCGGRRPARSNASSANTVCAPDARRGWLAVLGDEPVAQLAERAAVGEEAAHDELGRHRAVPAVLLEPEGDDPSGRRAGTSRAGPPSPNAMALPASATVATDAEAEVLALADGGEGGELAAGGEQHHAGIAEPERRELLELGAEVERELLSARHDRVDPGDGREVVVDEHAGGVRRRTRPRTLEVLRDGSRARRRRDGRPSARAAPSRRRARRAGRRRGWSGRSPSTRPRRRRSGRRAG